MFSLSRPISSRFPALRWDVLVIILALLALTGVAWANMHSRYQSMGTMSLTSMDSMSMSMEQRSFWGDAALFLPMWSVMIVAVMLPTMMPMVLIFSTIYRNRRAKGQVYVPTWVFLLGYMIVWALSGAPGYLAKVGLESLVDQFPSFQSAGAVIGGLVLIGAGLYQLSPLKDKCLSHCRTPLGFIMHDWREGYGGALRMGVRHGWYCLGCCWALMIVMFPVGVMNLVWMGALAVLIFVEKLVPHGRWVSRLSGLALMVAGVSLAAGIL